MDNQQHMSPPPQITEDLLLSFGDALKAAVKGHKITRLSWDPKNNDYGLMVDGLLTLHRQDKFSGWHVSDGDIEAEDWMIYNG